MITLCCCPRLFRFLSSRGRKGFGFWVFFAGCTFLSEPESRARDPGRVTDPPALNQRDARCVIAPFLTHTHTQINGERQGSIQRKFVKKRKQRRPRAPESQPLSI